MRVHPSIRGRRPALVRPIAAALLLPAAAGAQAALPDSGDWQPRGTFAAYFVVAEPKAEFASYVDNGWGFAGHGVLNLDRGGILGLRLDGGWLNYGRERRRLEDPFLGGRFRFDLTTSNNIVFLGVGPQLQWPNRYLRPYAYAQGGFAYLSTTSTLEDIDDQQIARDTNYDDWTLQWAGGGGVAIPVYRGRTSDVSLDVGGRYHFNGRARYLREGGIRDLPDGSVELEVLESRVHLITWHVGLSVGVR